MRDCLMKCIRSFLAVMAMSVVLVLATTSEAALSFLQNGGFEEGNDGTKYVGSFDVAGWEEFDGWDALGTPEIPDSGLGVLLWTYDNDDPADDFFPDKTGDGALGFDHPHVPPPGPFDPPFPDPDSDKSWAFQSIGVLDAGDVGRSLTFDINAGARGMMAPTVITIAFRTGTEAGVGGVAPPLGTVLGTAGTLLLDSSASPDPLEMAPVPQATYTVDAADIGKEIFAVISSELVGPTEPNSGGQIQFLLDDAVLDIPEPTALLLALCAALSFVGCRRNRN